MEPLTTIYTRFSTEIQRRINTPLVLLNLFLLLIGAGLVVYALPQKASSMGMLGITAGGLLAVIAVVYLLFRSQRWVYIPTGSPLRQVTAHMEASRLPELREKLSAFSTAFSTVHSNADKTTIRIDCTYSADRKFAAVQLSQYSTLLYTPMMDVCYIGEDNAPAFVDFMLKGF